MSIDSGAEALPRKNRRVAEQHVEGELSPGLRKHIARAAERIRGAYQAELADVRMADRAGRLFSSLIGANGRPAGAPNNLSGASGEVVGVLAGELGGLVSEAIRAGTGLLGNSLTVLTQAWMATVLGPSANPNPIPNPDTNPGTSSATGPVSPEPSPPQPAAPPPLANSVETPVPASEAAAIPVPSAEELMLLEVLRQFMPMLLTAVNQGGDGYGLAKTVIALFGRSTYDEASEPGSDKIMQLIKREPDLWNQVAPIEARFSKFLDEFTSYGHRADVQPPLL